ncbi:hypothetical protein L6452_03645 [Arctium lappa]|uniref:Uncharacterized protein n=1 Tax=Arctium lappa TaxID=4217 RepID=A0ACB9FMW8_ARCLA|nr:hypothetical protein L6452_03645 [Arctium lappa]
MDKAIYGAKSYGDAHGEPDTGTRDFCGDTHLEVLDGSEWRVKLGRSSSRMTLVALSGFEKIADLVVVVTPVRLCSRLWD